MENVSPEFIAEQEAAMAAHRSENEANAIAASVEAASQRGWPVNTPDGTVMMVEKRIVQQTLVNLLDADGNEYALEGDSGLYVKVGQSEEAPADPAPAPSTQPETPASDEEEAE